MLLVGEKEGLNVIFLVFSPYLVSFTHFPANSFGLHACHISFLAYLCSWLLSTVGVLSSHAEVCNKITIWCAIPAHV